jgi:hypothetical protein
MVRSIGSNTPLQRQNALEYHPELFAGFHGKLIVFCPWIHVTPAVNDEATNDLLHP